jgi:uncharacterized protein (DUF4213/DUF364 family)
MSVATELLRLIDRLAAVDPLPPVAALHLPHAAAAGSRDGEFCALELADGSIGLSYVLLGDTLPALYEDAGLRELAGMPAARLASWYAEADPVRRTIGFAAINAISQRALRRAGIALDTASDSLGLLDPQPDERIGMIGLFRGLVARIVERGATLTVLELKAELAGEFDGWRVTTDASALAGCSKVLSTTTLLLNDTLEPALRACSGARRIAMVGPSGGCLPDPLFARGVTLLGGTLIADRSGFLSAFSRGEPWSRFATKYFLQPGTYPGFEALLAALAAGKREGP